LATTETWFLEEAFGNHGPALQARARGEDDTPVCPPWERPQEKSIGHEQTFVEDTEDYAFLRAKLQDLLSSAARRLRRKGLLARKISVRLRWADFVTVSRDLSLSVATDHDGELLEPALDLLGRMHDRRTLVRLLGVRLSGLVRGYWQGRLGDAVGTRERSLVHALDGIRDRHGETAVRCGETVRIPAHRR